MPPLFSLKPVARAISSLRASNPLLELDLLQEKLLAISALDLALDLADW